MQGLHTTFSKEHYQHLLKKKGPKVAEFYKQKCGESDDGDLENGAFNFGHWNRLMRVGQVKKAEEYKARCNKRIKIMATKSAEIITPELEQQLEAAEAQLDGVEQPIEDQPRATDALIDELEVQETQNLIKTPEQIIAEDSDDDLLDEPGVVNEADPIVAEIDGVGVTNKQLNEKYTEITGKNMSPKYRGSDAKLVQWKLKQIEQAAADLNQPTNENE